jgi:ABC-2 type transport system ATP-binding protein
MIEVWSENARAALEPARRMEGVHSVSLYGDRLHIALEQGTSGEEIIHRLGNTGIGVKDFREILPSLEDVFISMVE